LACKIQIVSERCWRRIGIFGGTFDPPHNGHLAAGIHALNNLHLDTVLFTVANDPWQKTDSRYVERSTTVTSAVQRLDMVLAATEGIIGLQADDREILRGGVTYTADTLIDLSEEYPKSKFVLLIGADVASSLDTWIRVEEVCRLAEIVVMTRPDYDQISVPDGFKYRVLEVPAFNISSSWLRKSISAGKDISEMVPDGVLEVIDSFGLYRD
tara:strand:- start:370 stop:1005 length:636 start_codon:yes stop_codon:yes gene_type:complete